MHGLVKQALSASLWFVVWRVIGVSSPTAICGPIRGNWEKHGGLKFINPSLLIGGVPAFGEVREHAQKHPQKQDFGNMGSLEVT